MKRLNRPLVTQETIKAMEDMSFFTHAMIFDDLLIIAQRETSCFVLWTTDGLIIIDAIWPARPAFDAIVNAISDAGLLILITISTFRCYNIMNNTIKYTKIVLKRT